MKTVLFNFNNEAGIVTLHVNEETSAVTIEDASGRTFEFPSVQAFAESFARTRDVLPENFKNWVLLFDEETNTYSYVQRASTGGDGYDDDEEEFEDEASETQPEVPTFDIFSEGFAFKPKPVLNEEQKDVLRALTRSEYTMEVVKSMLGFEEDVEDLDVVNHLIDNLNVTSYDLANEFITQVKENLDNYVLTDTDYLTAAHIYKALRNYTEPTDEMVEEVNRGFAMAEFAGRARAKVLAYDVTAKAIVNYLVERPFTKADELIKTPRGVLYVVR